MASDQVIWSHTLIKDPIALAHFTIVHFLEKVITVRFQSQRIELSREKDCSISAIMGSLIIDSLGKNQFLDIFKVLDRSREDGGVGWKLSEIRGIHEASCVDPEIIQGPQIKLNPSWGLILFFSFKFKQFFDSSFSGGTVPVLVFCHNL